MPRYYEDWTLGETIASQSFALSRESVLAFAREYDPQPFHVDDEAAATSLFGRLAASGWQTASATMRLIVDLGIDGVGIGVDDLRWHKPVYPGDTLRVSTECAAKRTTPEKPSGVVHFKNTTYNQYDERVMSHVAIVLVKKRPSP